MNDIEIYKLFERIAENESVSGIQKATAEWVLDLYSRYEDKAAKVIELEEEIEELNQQIADNTIDPHEEKRSYYNSTRF